MKKWIAWGGLLAALFLLPYIVWAAEGDPILQNSEGGISLPSDDGKHHLNVSNSGAENFTETEGDLYFRRDTNIWLFYDGSEWDWLISDEAFEGNTETLITVTAQTDGTVDFVVSSAAVSNGDTTHVPTCDGVYDFCETTQNYLKTSEHVGANETYGSGWNADTSVPEKDDIYDYLHGMDSDDDGVLTDESWFSQEIAWTIIDSDTDVAVADGKQAFTVPAALNGFDIVDVVASVHTKGVTGTTDIQIRRRRAGSDVDVLSTKVTIGDEWYASDEVVNTSNDDLQTGDQIYPDVDAIHSGTAPKGLSVSVTCRKP